MQILNNVTLNNVIYDLYSYFILHNVEKYLKFCNIFIIVCYKFVILRQCIRFSGEKLNSINLIALERRETMTRCFSFQPIFNFLPDIRLDQASV